MIILDQLKMFYNVSFSYLEADNVSFRINKDNELEKCPNYVELPNMIKLQIKLNGKILKLCYGQIHNTFNFCVTIF